jgi:F0F1-type ATP synthase membrane subunit b/b'
MAELKLKPELIPMVIEGAFYLAALASSHLLLIKPLLSLTAERRRRTQGMEESAKGLEQKLERLEKTYNDAQKVALVEARDMLNYQILAGQAEASVILQDAHEAAKIKMQDAKEKITQQLSQERSKIPAIVSDLSDAVIAKLVKASLVFSIGQMFFSSTAWAGGGAVDPIYGILWPYFQFIVFAAALTFFAGKTISKMLDARRDALRTQLSEAREAMTKAQRKSEEYEIKLKNLQSEIEKLRKEYADDGVRQRDKLIHDAKESAAQLLRDTERTAKHLIEEGRIQLKKEIFEQVVLNLDARLKDDTLKAVDASLRQSAFQGLRETAQISQSH